MRRRLGILLPALGLLGLLAVPAHATHLRGIKATITNLDVPSLTADMDVTVYAANSTNTSTATTTVGFTFFGYPAVDWGDGAGLITSKIPAVAAGPPAVFRGSFSHTYAGAGPYTVTVATNCCGRFTATGTITGNRRTPSEGEYIFTNTTTVDFASVPATHWQALAALAATMLLAGVYLLRR